MLFQLINVYQQLSYFNYLMFSTIWFSFPISVFIVIRCYSRLFVNNVTLNNVIRITLFSLFYFVIRITLFSLFYSSCRITLFVIQLQLCSICTISFTLRLKTCTTWYQLHLIICSIAYYTNNKLIYKWSKFNNQVCWCLDDLLLLVYIRRWIPLPYRMS